MIKLNTSAMTLADQLERNARLTPAKTAIIFHSDKINYGDLNDIVNRLANALRDLGVQKADRVGLMLPRIPELVMGFLAVAKVQGIAVPVNFELPAERLRCILGRISSPLLIVHSQFLDLIRKSLPVTSAISLIVVGEGDGKCLRWDEVLRQGKTDSPRLDVKDDDVVYLNYTSGSTGDAKGAMTTHANIYWNTLACVEALGLTPEDVHLCMFAPFAHPHEIFARALYLGGTMVLADKIYPKSLAEAISRHKVSCMMGLAPMYENLLEVLEHKDYDLSSLRIPESGGMYTRLNLIENFKREVGVSIIPVWGSTETTGVAIANRPDEPVIPGSVGRPCPFYEVRIVDECGLDLPVGETGEMIFKGPAVVTGYYEGMQDNQGCFKDGWYYSGDLARRDRDGNFYFVDRITGMMKVAGLKVYPLEIELTLIDCPGVKEAAVVRVQDRLRGEVPRAIVAAREGATITEKDIIHFCKGRLPHYKVPRFIEIRECLPKSGSGKIDKKALQMECV